MTQLFLVGYEKRTLNGFLKNLTGEGITAVVDVRDLPLSRRNGFSKNSLAEFLHKNGIKYYHFGSLGAPAKIRQELKKEGNYIKFFKDYDKYISTKSNVLTALFKTVDQERPALLCYEREYDLCHRTMIANKIIKIHPNIKVIPI